MTKNIFAVSLLALVFSACCGSKKSSSNNGNETAIRVPYAQAKNYFVRNDYKEAPIHVVKLTSLADFEKVLGRAPLEMSGGNPTKIDFSKEYALAVIDESNDYSGDLVINEVSQDKDGITVWYSLNKGDKMSFTKRYVAVLVVDNKYQSEVRLKKN